MSRHHKKPETLAGTDNDSNIAHVSQKQHDAWHRLFGELNGWQIADRINYDNFFGDYYVAVSLNRKVNVPLGAHNYCKKPEKRKEDWELLFGAMTYRSIIIRINNTWLDPDFTMILHKKKRR